MMNAIAKELVTEHRARSATIERARERLRRDPEDKMAWRWLQWGLTGLSALEYRLLTMGVTT
jgi:hypothetical protein